MPLKEALASSALADHAGPVGQRIAQLLQEAIITNRLPPGQALPESELAELLMVSRQPVREALIRLAARGLLRILPQRGTLVTRISLAGVRGGRFVREAVECAVIRQAAGQATEADLTLMRQNIELQTYAVRTGDHARFLALDDALHRAFAAAMDHEGAWSALHDVKLQMDRVRYLSIPDATPSEVLIWQHRAIVDALARCDADAAEQAMRTHLSEVLAALPKLLERFPSHFDTEAAA